MGAGLLGFSINISLYYMQGLNMTAALGTLCLAWFAVKLIGRRRTIAVEEIAATQRAKA